MMAPDEIHVHVLRFGSMGYSRLPRGWRKTLSAEELRAYQGLRDPEKRREFLWSRWLVRRSLARYLRRRKGTPRDSRRRGGKPFLPGMGLEMSLSHTEGLVTCCFGRRAVGIDVERVVNGPSDRRRFSLLARRFFTARENKDLDAMSPERRSREFLRLFTVKEAYGKALGRGLEAFRRPPRLPVPLGRRFRSRGREFLTDLRRIPGYCLALVSRSGVKPVRYRFQEWAPRDFGRSVGPPVRGGA